MKSGAGILLTAFILAMPLSAIAQAPPPAAAHSADAKLRALYTAEWAWRLKEYEEEERPDGRTRSTARFPDVDAAAQARRLAYWQDMLKQLGAIPRAQLSHEERINADVFEAVLRENITDTRYKLYEAPFNSDSFFWADLTPRSGLENAEEYRRYIGRIKDLPRYFDQQIANMRAGLKRGFTPPRPSIEGRDKTVEPYLKEGAENPLYIAFTQMPAAIPAAEQKALQAEALAAIRASGVPAYTKLLKMLREEYWPGARTSLAAVKLPDGPAFYQAQIEKFTTLKLTAQQIHNIGLKEVARIRAEMEAVKAKAGFKGSLPEFFIFLRTDPQFYAKTPEQLMGVASYVVLRAQGKLAANFGTLPRFRHGVIPVPDDIAPIYTSGRGGLSNCMFNTYNLPQRPLHLIPALALHECTPGHSFQAALALEGPKRPRFRANTYFSGYGEGWGLYTEWLGREMGIYRTPYEEFGQLGYEMWRAARLVVDTGIHLKGWSRDQALRYFADNVPLSEHERTTEIDRYIGWPGQALSYKLGEMQIRRHRADAERRLGTKFDVRKFHDTFLNLGSVPLPTLEREMEAFIARGGEMAK